VLEIILVFRNNLNYFYFQDPGQGTVPEEEVTVPPRKVNGGQSEKKSLIDSTSKFLDDFNPVNIS
jgi:hypothetical protein